MNPIALLVMAAAIAAVLVLLFPGDNYNDPRYTSQPDGLSLAYLKAILRLRPDDPGLRRALATQQLAFSLLDDAMSTLDPITDGTTKFDREAEWLALDVERRQFFSGRISGPARGMWRSRIQKRIERFLKSGPSKGALDRLAQVGLEIGDQRLGARIYLRLAALGGPDAGRAFGEAARWFLAAGDHRAAADAFRKGALVQRNQPKRGLGMAEQAIDVMIATSNHRRALELTEEFLTVFPDALSLVDRGAKLSLTLDDLRRARSFTAERVRRRPDDLVWLEEHRRLELANRGVGRALRASRSIVNLRPNDPVERRRLAEIAEWGSDALTAQINWLWLYRHGDRSAFEPALRLSRMLYDWDVILELLEHEATLRPLTYEEVEEMARAYETIGSPEKASLVAMRLGDPRDRRIWLLVARIEERAGRLSESLGAWRELNRRFEWRLVEVTTQAELMWRLGAPGDARTLLTQAADLAHDGDELGADDERYFHLLGELSWLTERSQDATRGYRSLWNARKASPEEIVRFMLLLGEAGRKDELVDVGRKAWALIPDPAFLIVALQAAAERERWQEVETLMALADTRPQVFQKREIYWLLRALLAREKGELDRAEQAFGRALAINPVSDQARLGWLWLALARNDHPRLKHLVHAWYNVATENDSYARPFAEALDRLGHETAALSFYDRSARADPTNLDFLDMYADALDRARRPDAALRLRTFILQSRRTLLMAESLRTRRDQSLLSASAPGQALAYTRLVNRMQGSGAAWPLIEALLSKGAKDTDVQRFGFDLEIGRQNLDGAQRWLARIDRKTVEQDKLRLAMALADDDDQNLAVIYASHAEKLSLPDRVSIERRLGRHQVARTLVSRGLSESLPESDRVQLVEHLRELVDEESWRLDAETRMATFGPVMLLDQTATLAVPHALPGRLDDVKLGGRASLGRVLSRDSDLLLADGQTRATLMADARWTGRRFTAIGRLGVEGATDRSTPQGGLTVGAKLPVLGSGTRIEVEGGFHETPKDAGMMSALGRRNRLAGRLDFGHGRREYAALTAALNQDATRAGEFLGTTRLLGLELGSTLSLAAPYLRAYLQGALATSTRADGIPNSVVPRLGARASLDTLVPGAFQSVAAGLSLESSSLFENATHGPLLRYALDLSTGWLWPANRLMLRAETGIAVRVLPGHLVGLRAFVSRSQGGRAGESDYGLMARYQVAWD